MDIKCSIGAPVRTLTPGHKIAGFSKEITKEYLIFDDNIIDSESEKYTVASLYS